MTDFTQEKITIDVRCLRICDTVLDTGDFQSFYQRGSLDAVVYRVLLFRQGIHDNNLTNWVTFCFKVDFGTLRPGEQN